MIVRMLANSNAARSWSSSQSYSTQSADFIYPSRIEVRTHRRLGTIYHDQDYQIIAQIGKGAFGTVFEAHVRGRRVAIKALSKSIIKRNNLSQRVRNEVSIHYQLRHPNVLELLHFFEDSEHVFMIMELAAGELYQRVRKQRLSDADLRKVFAALVEGLIYLHSHGIIHRDLKLSNILLSDNMSPVLPFGFIDIFDRKLLILAWLSK